MIEEARKSPIQYKLAASILKNAKPVCKPTHNTHCTFIHGHQCSSLHAEHRAILKMFPGLIHCEMNGFKVKYKKDAKFKHVHKKKDKLNMIVIRLNCNDQLVNARPCFYCLNLMKAVGIKRVYYSVDINKIVCENVRDMISIQVSSITKRVQRDYYKASCDDKIFFENLLKKRFPLFIKKINFDMFIKYNYSLVLPKYSYMILNNKQIVFSDTNGRVVFESTIV